jgi:hypothetical protein
VSNNFKREQSAELKEYNGVQRSSSIQLEGRIVPVKNVQLEEDENVSDSEL